jgi:hypothetical protein
MARRSAVRRVEEFILFDVLYEMSRKGFTDAMAAHSYPKDKSRGVRGYAGIDLKPVERSRTGFD